MPRLIGNVTWFVLGGFFMGLAWWFYGLLCFITNVGIPFGIQHVKLAGIALFPIGQSVVLSEVADATRAARRG